MSTRIPYVEKMYSPRMWRWSLLKSQKNRKTTVFSTYVEVIPCNWAPGLVELGILHVCGGDPRIPREVLHLIQYSPRMWRWSRLAGMKMGCLFVFSTYVEVILGKPFPCLCQCRILHVCGGDPNWHGKRALHDVYSPRMWRWSPLVYASASVFRVFSTYVEVILLNLQRLNRIQSILHVCGGDPD